MPLSTLLMLMLLLASLVVPTLSGILRGSARGYPALPLPFEIAHQFPIGPWMENLVIRHNGEILTTALSSPELFQVDNHGKKAVKLVHTFANKTGCTSIAELGRDTFYVIAGNFNVSNLAAVPGSWSVYKLHLPYHLPHTEPKPARVSLVANFPRSIMLNSITVLSNRRKWLLINDSKTGIVYRLEAKKGTLVKRLKNPLMKPSSPSAFGVNGVKIRKNHLYFTNSDRKILACQPIKHNVRPRRSDKLVAHIHGGDDFTFNAWFRSTPSLFVAQNDGVDGLERVVGNRIVTMAGGPSGSRSNSKHLDSRKRELFGPIAVRFGKLIDWLYHSKADKTYAYISTNGGTAQYLSGNITRSGTILRVDVMDYY